jgi:hypothetical protein
MGHDGGEHDTASDTELHNVCTLHLTGLKGGKDAQPVMILSCFSPQNATQRLQKLRSCHNKKSFSESAVDDSLSSLQCKAHKPSQTMI